MTARRLLRVRSRPDPERVVRLPHAKLLEEDLGHLAVVVLACVDEHVLELVAPPAERRGDRRDLHHVRPRADDREHSAAGGHAARIVAAAAFAPDTLTSVKQVVLRGGKTQVVEVPEPAPSPGSVLVANAASAISSGTERSVVASGSGSLAARAIKNPNLVAQTLKHAREHGVRETIGAVRGAVAQDNPLGYSSAGTVLDTGGHAGLHVGQRVACAGAGRANHAEVVSVPPNLVVPVPEGVSLRDASFSAIGAIAIQGVRRAEPSLGDRVVVVGLGLLGLITVQALRAAGARVAGVEPLEKRRDLARELGAELALAPDEAEETISAWTGGAGADAVVVTASAKGGDLVNQAVRMLRRKGKVVPVGDVGLEFDREALYEREADVLISTSYGPGRYDPSYEEGGLDYPLPYVRWTAGRNMEEYLRLVADGLVKLDPLVELELPVDRATEAYEALAADAPPPAAVLTYPERARETARVVRSSASSERRDGEVRVAIIGAGSFVRGMHVPNLQRENGVRVTTVVSRGGSSAESLARSLNGARSSTDWREAVDAPDVDLVVVGTRHDSHAEIAAAALRAGKAVFVEKPLGLTREQIDDVWRAGDRERPARDRLQPAIRAPLPHARPAGPLAGRPPPRRVPHERARRAGALAQRPARGWRPHPRRGVPPLRLRELAVRHPAARPCSRCPACVRGHNARKRVDHGPVR